jgi:hypothetical protein
MSEARGLPAWRCWAALGAGLLAAAAAACPGDDDAGDDSPGDDDSSPEPTPDPWGDTPGHLRDPAQILQPRVDWLCPDFPKNAMGYGEPCGENADCGGELPVCVQGLVPGESNGRCTRHCRRDLDCSPIPLWDEDPGELICVAVQDQLSVCVATACLDLANVPGFTTMCTPAPVAVNEGGVGLPCTGMADCSGLDASICPPPEAMSRFCTKNCNVDADCGPGAACACVEDAETCTDNFFICAPLEGCAEAIRHHHCRGPGIPPVDHEDYPCLEGYVPVRPH